MTLVDKETLTSGHVPLADGGVGRAGKDQVVQDGHGVDVARVTLQDAQTLCLGGLGRPHSGIGVFRAGDQERLVVRQGHAVDALFVISQGLLEELAVAQLGCRGSHDRLKVVNA